MVREVSPGSSLHFPCFCRLPVGLCHVIGRLCIDRLSRPVAAVIEITGSLSVVLPRIVLLRVHGAPPFRGFSHAVIPAGTQV